MQSNDSQRIIELCDAAIHEHNSEKRFKIIQEISELIDKLANDRRARAKISGA